MKNLLVKELKLSALPLSYFFILFGVMAMIPDYPILVGAFFVWLGIFQSFQSGRENNDILYTVLLPVKKSDAVKAKFAFTCFIELCSFALMFALTMVRMIWLADSPVYTQNVLMNANPIDLNRLTGAVPLSWFTGRKYEAETEAPVETPVENGYTNYIVKRGDTLWGIAKKFLGSGTKYVLIMELNGLANITIHAGDVLKIPEKG